MHQLNPATLLIHVYIQWYRYIICHTISPPPKYTVHNEVWLDIINNPIRFCVMYYPSSAACILNPTWFRCHKTNHKHKNWQKQNKVFLFVTTCTWENDFLRNTNAPFFCLKWNHAMNHAVVCITWNSLPWSPGNVSEP